MATRYCGSVQINLKAVAGSSLTKYRATVDNVESFVVRISSVCAKEGIEFGSQAAIDKAAHAALRSLTFDRSWTGYHNLDEGADGWIIRRAK